MTYTYAASAEIQRFESVHPSIYALYELIDSLDNVGLQNEMQELVASIEDAFINSQEWTLNRCIKDIRIGLVGSCNSGKSALVHRFLTGSYMQDESPEGGRFKKELILDDESYLMLIRDEGGAPDEQFTNWIDAVIFIFSLESEESFKTVYRYYNRMLHYRHLSNIPLILVGTQDAINENNPRVIDDIRARKMSFDLRHCPYYETCSTYGLNVDKVFVDVCQQVVKQRYSSQAMPYMCCSRHQHKTHEKASGSESNSSNRSLQYTGSSCPVYPAPIMPTEKVTVGGKHSFYAGSAHSSVVHLAHGQLKQKTNKREHNDKNENIGHGRAIPIKEGYLQKKGTSGLNKDWKKKYVVLLSDGRLVYHPTMNDYRDDIRGKEINLQRVTVKIPSLNKPRFTNTKTSAEGNHRPSSDIKLYRDSDPSCISSLDGVMSPCLEATVITNSSVTSGLPNVSPSSSMGVPRLNTPTSKKRHRKMRSAHSKDYPKEEETDDYDFVLVSIDNKQWHFETNSYEEREEWINAIQQQILISLQNNESSKTKLNSVGLQNEDVIHSLRKIPGNQFCADCNQSEPMWASVNLGILICIECSGVHRQLGTHISRVRSLELDDWPLELLLVMRAFGNSYGNSIWEADCRGFDKPIPSSSREFKMKWIRMKYKLRHFVNCRSTVVDTCELLNALSEPRKFYELLAVSQIDIISAALPDKRYLIHVAAAIGEVVALQLLIWIGVDITSLDGSGKTALFYARQSNNALCEAILINSGCPLESPRSLSNKKSIPYDRLPSSFI